MCELTLEQAGLKRFCVKMKGRDQGGMIFRSTAVIPAKSSLEAFGIATDRMKVCDLAPLSITVGPARV